MSQGYTNDPRFRVLSYLSMAHILHEPKTRPQLDYYTSQAEPSLELLASSSVHLHTSIFFPALPIKHLTFSVWLYVSICMFQIFNADINTNLTFLVFKRMEKLAIRSSSSQAKIIGTVVSISGALVVTLYKGPPIISTQPASISLHRPLGSPHSDWVIGSLFLTVEFMLVPMWYIVQVHRSCCKIFNRPFIHTFRKSSLSCLLHLETDTNNERVSGWTDRGLLLQLVR